MKKQQWILVGITGVFLCLLVGIFIGRNLTGAYIPVDKVLHSQSTNPSDEAYNPDGKLDINTATVQQLQLLPGIGESTAQNIIFYREENGKFKTIEDLLNISGIGPAKFEKIKPYIKANQ